MRTRLLLGSLELLAMLTRVLPPRVADPLCRRAGNLWYLSAPVARAAVRDNLQHMLGHAPTWRQVRAVFQAGAFNYWDTIAIPSFDRQKLLERINLHGVEHLRAAHATGKGVILATAHLGSPSLVGQVIPALGFPLVGLLEPIEPPELYAFFARQRQALGPKLLPAGPAGLRELLRALQRGETLGLVTDRDITNTGPMVQFFDAPAHWPDGAAALAVRTGAPVLAAAAVRRSDGTFEGWIDTPLPRPATGDAREDVRQLSQAIATRLQYYIASYPEQWTVFQKRWPSR